MRSSLSGTGVPASADTAGNPAFRPLRTLVVTAANEAFAPLLRGLVDSLHQWQPRPFTALACFDLGLAPATRDWIGQRAQHVIVPEWDLPVHRSLRQGQPQLRALTTRPFLRRYFPGYDFYLWIDADAWVQQRDAVESYFTAASDGAMAIVAHDHPAYHHSQAATSWRVQRRRECFGRGATSLPLANYWNAGVFALAASAPHWETWSNYFNASLDATGGKLCCDQTALNHAITVEKLPVAALTARENWLCHLALPAFDVARNQYCDPLGQQPALGILHLAAHTKDIAVPLQGDAQGRTLDLRFPPRARAAAASGAHSNARLTVKATTTG